MRRNVDRRRKCDFLFAISTTDGGAFSSTLELAQRLEARGFLVDIFHENDRGSNWHQLYKRLTNLEVKLGRPRFLTALAVRVGAGTSEQIHDGIRFYSCAILENGIKRRLRHEPPRTIVATAISRVGWQRIRKSAAQAEVPIAFYLRGQTMVRNLTLAAPPEYTLVNSDALVPEVQALGIEPQTVYSVIDLSKYQVATSRESALVINPITDYGSDLALQIAAKLPEIQFDFRESHAMSPQDRAKLLERIEHLTNVSLLPPTKDVSELYGRARVLLVPYPRGALETNRPRVVLEAQRSGIPVIASNIAGLKAVLGDHGLIADSEDADTWVEPIHQMWSDESLYSKRCQAATEAANSPSLDPDFIVDQFLAAVAPSLTL